MDFPEGEFTVFLNKGCVVDFTKESPPIHFLCNGDETQKSWKPLLNMISALRGSFNCTGENDGAEFGEKNTVDNEEASMKDTLFQ